MELSKLVLFQYSYICNIYSSKHAFNTNLQRWSLMEMPQRLMVLQAIQELIRRWDSERELFNDDIAHT